MSSTGDPVRWGVLGCASIATRKVVPGMRGRPGLTVLGIASRDAARARADADGLGIERSYGTYDDLLADPDIEAVYIPLPNHLHAEWTMRAADAGKHVLCEKPLAMHADEAGAMAAHAEAAGVLLMEAFMYRLHPQWQLVKRLVDEGAIGEVLAVQTVFAYRNVDPANIRNVAEYGGGALLDIGCYAVNSARFLLGTEPRVVGATIRRDPAFHTDVVTSAVLDFGGPQLTFTVSTQAESDQRVLVLGTEGRLVVEIPFNIPPDRPTRVLRIAGGEPPVAPAVEVLEVPADDQYGVMAEGFSRAVRGEAPLPTPIDDALATAAVLDAIVAAAG